MSPQGHRPGPDSRTLPGPAVSRLQCPRLQSQTRPPQPERPSFPNLPTAEGRWESWEDWENWELWEDWENWELWESNPLLSSPILTHLFPNLPKTPKIPITPITPNPPSTRDCELQPNQMMGELGGLRGRGEVEIGGQNKSHPLRFAKPTGMAFVLYRIRVSASP